MGPSIKNQIGQYEISQNLTRTLEFSKRRWGLFPELQTENDGDTEPGVRMCLEGVLKGTEGCLIDAWQQV